MTPQELALTVADCGFVLQLDNKGNPSLSQVHKDAVLPPELLEQLKANRYAIRNWILSMTDPVECSVCKRDLTDPEDRERVKDAAFCDRGGAKEQHHRKTGGIVFPMAQRCPYKPRET